MKVNKLRKELDRKKLQAVLISDAVNIAYLTGYSNFSKDEREAYLLITKKQQFIITDGRYKEAILRQVPHFELIERSIKIPLKDILKKFKKQVKSLGVEENDLTVLEHKLLLKTFKILKHLDIKKTRAIKSKEEIEKIKKAAKLGDETFSFILKKIKPGISEKQLANELEFFIKKNGSHLSFPSIVAFGRNCSVPHHQTAATVLKKGDFVLLDFGVRFENYCSDMTRTIFFKAVSSRQRNIYETVLTAQLKAVDFVNANVKVGKRIKAFEVDKVAREYILSKGYPTIPHSLGHGIGLDVHEHPSLSSKSKEELKLGMVFSIEPGIYIPGVGGVRIEDLFVLEEDGLRQITTSPKEIIEI